MTLKNKKASLARQTQTIDQLCEQLDIKILNPREIPSRPRETRARQSLNAILEKFGEGHLVLTLKCITDSGNEDNARCLSSDMIFAVSDVLAANPHYDQFGLGLLDAFADIEMKALRERVRKRFKTDLRLRLETLIALELDLLLMRLRDG